MMRGVIWAPVEQAESRVRWRLAILLIGMGVAAF